MRSAKLGNHLNAIFRTIATATSPQAPSTKSAVVESRRRRILAHYYYPPPMRFGSRGPRKFLRPRQIRRGETFCLTWGGAFGSGLAVNNFSALMKDVYGVHLRTKIIENERQFQKLDYPCRNLVILIWNRNERSRNSIIRTWSYFEQVETIKGKLDIADVKFKSFKSPFN